MSHTCLTLTCGSAVDTGCYVLIAEAVPRQCQGWDRLERIRLAQTCGQVISFLSDSSLHTIKQATQIASEQSSFVYNRPHSLVHRCVAPSCDTGVANTGGGRRWRCKNEGSTNVHASSLVSVRPVLGTTSPSCSITGFEYSFLKLM